MIRSGHCENFYLTQIQTELVRNKEQIAKMIISPPFTAVNVGQFPYKEETLCDRCDSTNRFCEYYGQST